MKVLGIFVVALLALMMVPAPVAAQSSRDCAPRAEVEAFLSERYGEDRAALGVAGGGSAVIELWLAEGTGTWTITGTLTSGLTCLIASGRAWQAMPPAIWKGDPK